MSDQARARAEALFPQFTALAARALGPAKYRQEVIALLLRYRDEVRQEARSTTLDEVAIWLDDFEFPEARILAKQARIMAKDALEDAETEEPV